MKSSLFFTEILSRVNPSSQQLEELFFAHRFSLLFQASLPMISDLRARFLISEELRYPKEVPVNETPDFLEQKSRDRKATRALSPEEMKLLVADLLKTRAEPGAKDPLDVELARVIPANNQRTGGEEEQAKSDEVLEANPLEEYLSFQELAHEDSPELESKQSQSDLDNFEKFLRLAEQENWQSLIELVEHEQVIQDEPCAELQLWWIYAQLKLNSVPAIILSAPFETLSLELLEKQKYQTLASNTKSLLKDVVSEFSARLLDTGNFSFAMNFLERASQVDSSYLTLLDK